MFSRLSAPALVPAALRYEIINLSTRDVQAVFIESNTKFFSLAADCLPGLRCPVEFSRYLQES